MTSALRTPGAPDGRVSTAATRPRWALSLLLMLAAASALACGNTGAKDDADPAEQSSGEAESGEQGSEAGEGSAAIDDGRDPSCPAVSPADGIPGVEPAQLTADYWLERVGEDHDLDEVLLTGTDVTSLNVVNQHPALGFDELDRELVKSELTARLDWLRERLSDGRYVEADGSSMPADDLAHFEVPATLPALSGDVRVALEMTPIRCGPRDDGFYKTDLNLAFDRNNCSSLHAQEPVQIIATWGNGMRYVRTAYSSGWIAADAPLSPALDDDQIALWLDPGTRVRVSGGEATLSGGSATATVPNGTYLPRKRTEEGEIGSVFFATADGVHDATQTVGESLRPVAPLTRRALIETAFEYLDQPYGWGGADGGLDCSRFLLDLFAHFGLDLPRTSVEQARAGTFTIPLEGVESERERELLIEAAAEHGIVLLQMPGHIMLYLGRDEGGDPMALHSFSEYLAPCPGVEAVDEDSPSKGPQHAKNETLFTVGKVTVSDLELGRGSSRTAFIQRLTRITVIGKPPSIALRGAAELRAAAPVAEPDGRACSDSNANAIFFSPLEPNAEQPLRVIATHSVDPGAGQLVLIDPDGERIVPEVKQLGGPPFTWVATIDAPEPGQWTAIFGDGERVDACLRTSVDHRAPKDAPAGARVWEPRRRWTEATENLYAAWVESLFDYPIDDDRTWDNFHSLVQNDELNLLHDFYSKGETAGFDFEPDCADLPYFIRGYFAWNMGLPFGFRRCSRGKAGRPPSCNEEVLSHLQAPERATRADSFERFMNRHVRNVHSGCGRTAPGDDHTDYYPVDLTHEALRPGTLFADPDGHLMIVSKWVPQGTTEYGMLMAADAQPDATVGRRRFWRGSFLFTPDTTNVGAGFKAFRPLIYDDSTESLRALTNEEINDSADRGIFPAWSDTQYEGTRDDFYDRMASLINPRPLDPFAYQTWLIDALEEQVTRRVSSVNNGEQWKQENPGGVMEMPTGYHIFETRGPWEDFSTPSRDMRLLIAMDAVTDFARRVERAPENYGIEPAEAAEKVAELEAFRDQALADRTFEYTRSDGSAWPLTLADVIDRRETFEWSWNPNECVEWRWAARESDGDEFETCDTKAPKAQKKRVLEYRQWFTDRERPPR